MGIVLVYTVLLFDLDVALPLMHAVIGFKDVVVHSWESVISDTSHTTF